MPSTTFRIHVDDAGVKDAFKHARRDMNSRIRVGLSEAGKTALLPHARRIAAGQMPPPVVSSLNVRATSRRIYLSTRGSRLLDRIAGLLEFGGLVSTQIYPTKQRALTIAPGVVRAAVHKPRLYRGKHVLQRAVETSLPAVEDAMLPELMKAFAGLEHSP